MRLFWAIVCLVESLLCIASLGQPITLTRNGEHLEAPASKSSALRSYGEEDCCLTIDAGRIRLYIASDARRWPSAWECIEQAPNGTTTFSCGGSSLTAHSATYPTFAAALDAHRTEVAEIFWSLGQPQCLCSMRYLRMRDGIEPLPQDGERDSLLQSCYDKLDDPDWRVRDDASETLVSLPEPLADEAAVWLERQPLKDAPPEVQARVEYVLAIYPH